MRSQSMNGAIEERFLDSAGRPFAGAKGKKKRRPAVVMRLAFLVSAISVGFALDVSAQVTSQRLLDSAKEPQNWLMYSGDYAGHRYSTLDQISKSNAASIVPKWAYQTMAGGKFETTPLVVDGVLYATGADDRAFALDAPSGRPHR